MKHLKIFLWIIFLLPFIYTSSYFFIEIKSHLPSINERISSYDSSMTNYKLIKKMAIQEETIDGIAMYTFRSLSLKYLDRNNYRGSWHLLGLHWYVWMKLIYSKEELFSLWLSLFYYPGGQGINGAAEYYFDKNFAQLSCYQLAELTVAMRSPIRYKPNSKRSAKRIMEHNLLSGCTKNKMIE